MARESAIREDEGSRLRQFVLVAAMAAVICVLGPLSIPLPISPVPISFTNLAIYFIVYVLDWRRATAAYGIYLLLGFAGLPVFSAFTGGPGKLLGPTGGYLIGFIFMVMVCGYFTGRFGSRAMHLLGMVLGTAVAYLFGTVWLGYEAGYTFTQALALGVLPYLPGDLIKMAAACAVGPQLRARLAKAGL